MSVKVNHLTIVPAPILLLDVGQVEARSSQSLSVIWIHLGDPAVIGGRVQEIIRTMGWVIVIPRKMNIDFGFIHDFY